MTNLALLWVRENGYTLARRDVGVVDPWHLAFVEVEELAGHADGGLSVLTECGRRISEPQTAEPGEFLPVLRCDRCRTTLGAKVGL